MTVFIRWTKEERETLARVFPGGIREQIQAAIPTRNWSSICKRAQRQKLPSKLDEHGGVPWTKEDEQKLKDLVLVGSHAELRATFPTRTVNCIRHKAKALMPDSKLRIHEKYWSRADKEKLAKNFELKSRADLIAMFPERTWYSIIQQGQDLGLTRKAWASLRKSNRPLHPIVRALRDRRIAIKSKQSDIADIAGYSLSTIQRMESGAADNVSLATVDAIAGALGWKLQLVQKNASDATAVPDWLKRIIKEKLPKSSLISFEDFDKTDVERVKRIKKWAA